MNAGIIALGARKESVDGWEEVYGIPWPTTREPNLTDSFLSFGFQTSS
jgi:hypothetical protein